MLTLSFGAGQVAQQLHPAAAGDEADESPETELNSDELNNTQTLCRAVEQICEIPSLFLNPWL